MEDIEIPGELKEIWAIISNMEFNVVELKFALSWAEDNPDQIDVVKEFCYGARTIDEIRNKIENLENRIYELKIEDEHLRLGFTGKIATERLRQRRIRHRSVEDA